MMVMPDFFTSPLVQAATSVVILCILISAAFYVVASYRDYVAEDQETGSDALLKLQEMHRKGDISEEEIRTIQARTQQQSAGPIIHDEPTSPDDSSPNTQT